MARMYSRRKGKSGSKKPISSETPKWVKIPPKDVETIIVELANNGRHEAEIGIILRDQHGVPSVKNVTEKSISQILRENKLEQRLPSDLTHLIIRAAKIKNHMKAHKQDMDGKRGLQLTESKIRRLAKYYKANGVIEKDWRYENERLEFLGG
ncbi:MAG: 30S ribosomal protein S15 [archaeon]